MKLNSMMKEVIAWFRSKRLLWGVALAVHWVWLTGCATPGGEGKSAASGYFQIHSMVANRFENTPQGDYARLIYERTGEVEAKWLQNRQLRTIHMMDNPFIGAVVGVIRVRYSVDAQGKLTIVNVETTGGYSKSAQRQVARFVEGAGATGLPPFSSALKTRVGDHLTDTMVFEFQ